MDVDRTDIEYKDETNQDFSERTRAKLLVRAAFRCSNPNCRRLTAAYSKEKDKIFCIGEGAHIRANHSGGPRYVADYDASKIENGIWLCPTCHTLIDKDATNYPISLLEKWKSDAENENLHFLEDAKKDMFDYFASLKMTKETFDFATASDIQTIVILFAILNDRTVRLPLNYTDEADDELFTDFYSAFYVWFAGSKKVRKTFNNCKFQPPVSLNANTIQSNQCLVARFTEAICDDNISDFVTCDSGQAVLNHYDLLDYLFGKNNFVKIDEFCKYWSD